MVVFGSLSSLSASGRAGPGLSSETSRVEVAVVTCPKSFLVHPVYGVVGPVTGDELKL